MNLSYTRTLVITGTAISVGAGTAVTGGIGFIGLVVPHLLRPLVGHTPSRLLLASALGGGALLLAADILVRVVMLGPELKLGVLTALVGAPFFLWRFAAPLVETIRHQFVDNLLDTEMIACVFTANQISKKLQFGSGGNPCVDELPPTIAQRMGGSLDEVIASMGDLDRMYEEAKVFASS